MLFTKNQCHRKGLFHDETKKCFIQISIQIHFTRPPVTGQLIVGAAHT